MIDYKSPIEIWHSEMEMRMEDEVLKACQRIGVQVDKEELLKALQYDRGQYDKGYQDGLNADKWIPCEERLPSEIGCYLVTTDGRYNDIVDIAFYDSKVWYKASEVIAWQPLPQQYKKEGAE
jgi:hypothetical protein